jgi:hypothetical protein
MKSLTTGLLAQDDLNVQFDVDNLDSLTGDANAEVAAGLFAAFGVVWLVSLVLSIIVIAGMWKIYSKAGKAGWAAIIPIYNLIVLFEITGKPLWWIILFLIPVVNFIAPLIVMIFVYIALAERFGRGVGTALGLFFLPFIFVPMLGFGGATYQAAPAPAT